MGKGNAREQALNILYRIETQKSYSTQMLDNVSRDNTLDERDRALVHQLVKGTLERRGTLDHVLDSLVKSGVGKLTPWIRNILRLGTYQILFLTRIPVEAAVNESVNLARQHGHQGTIKLVNAVLRKVAAEGNALLLHSGSNSVEELATVHSHPPWMVERWVRQWGIEETIALCTANNRAWPPCLRTNTLRATTAQLRQMLQAEGVAFEPARYYPDCTIITALPPDLRLHTLQAYRDGLFLVQDESFALIGELVDPQPHELVVDLCSAPGGKTTHLAALMHDQGRVVAVDPHAHRLQLVRENCQRLHVRIVETVEGDGRTVALNRLADRILIDAPCSGTGVLGRRSDARWNKSPDDIPRLHTLQFELLTHAATLLRPGGCLVYTTCSLEPEENEGTVEAFLQRCPGYRRVPVAGRIPPELVDQSGYYRTWPHRHGMGGAFGAILIRDETGDRGGGKGETR
jgi:16S rRNA (cytosine967-C5)-methyltransferase